MSAGRAAWLAVDAVATWAMTRMVGDEFGPGWAWAAFFLVGGCLSLLAVREIREDRARDRAAKQLAARLASRYRPGGPR